MTPSMLIEAWVKARTASAMRAILLTPELSVLSTRWPAFWSAYLPAARSSRRSPAFRFAAEQLAAAEAALTAATSTSRHFQIAVARTYSREYWLEKQGGFEREVVARRQARSLLIFASPGWTTDPQWRTSDVTAMAAGIINTADISAIPILADALEEAGCDNEEWLALMRDTNQPWFAGARILETLI